MGNAKSIAGRLVRASGGRQNDTTSIWTARIEQSLSLR